MALNDDATLAVDTGDYYMAPVGTAAPADLRAPGLAWDRLGHSSLEDILTIESDGGDTTVIGTLQNHNLRTRRSNRTEVFTIILHQFDEPALKLYYGSNSTKLSDGSLTVPAQPTPTVCAFLAVFVDGANNFGLYLPKAEIFRGDDLEFADTEGLVGLPLSITPLQYGTNDWTYAVTPLGTVDGG